MEYKGIKIYDKVIIVEKTDSVYWSWKDNRFQQLSRPVNQGYVVEPKNKKMLENALNWARWYSYDKSLYPKNGSPYDRSAPDYEERQAQLKAYEATRKEENGIIHEYDNGQFEITLSESANGSSQGGKLSFWNCLIKAPDGKEFLIGINAELLLHMMMNNTLINGKCQAKVYLGRASGNVGVFTDTMEEFAQSKTDADLRAISKTGTSAYKPGDILQSLTGESLYYGEVKEVYKSFWYNREQTLFIVFNTKPVIKYAYGDPDYIGKGDLDLKNSKSKKKVLEHINLNYTAVDYQHKYFEAKVHENLESQNADAYSYWAREKLRYVDPTESWNYESFKQKYNDILEKAKELDSTSTNTYARPSYKKYVFLLDTEADEYFTKKNINPDYFM